MTGKAATGTPLALGKESADKIERGQLIGYVGTTGRSTGCHLHFATLNDGQYVNPRIWIG